MTIFISLCDNIVSYLYKNILMNRPCVGQNLANRGMKIPTLRLIRNCRKFHLANKKDKKNQMKSSFLLLLLCCSSFCALHAQPSATDSFKKVRQPIQRFYVGNGLDAAIFSSATIQHTVNGITTNS